MIGMALNQPSAVETLLNQGISEESFNEPTNQAIWKALIEKRLDYLGAAYPTRIARLKETAPITQNIEFYAAELLWTTERMRLASELAELAKTIVKRKDPAMGGEIRKKIRAVSELIDHMEAAGHGQG